MTDCYHHWKPFLFLIYLFWYPPKKRIFCHIFHSVENFFKELSPRKSAENSPGKNIERGLNPIFYAVKTVVIDARKIRELLLLLAKVES